MSVANGYTKQTYNLSLRVRVNRYKIINLTIFKSKIMHKLCLVI